MDLESLLETDNNQVEQVELMRNWFNCLNYSTQEAEGTYTQGLRLISSQGGSKAQDSEEYT
ncbi:MAG: hypothetical protein Kow00121_64110 [Elainellaceae cyanobacterium]